MPSPYLQTGSLVRIANPAVGSFVVASRHKEVTVTEQNDNPDSDDEGDGNDDGGGSVHSKSTSKSNGSMSVGKTSLKALASILTPSTANEENRMSRYIYTLEKNRLKFHATFDGQTDGGQPKATSNSLWILEEQHGPIRSDLVSNSTQYRLRNFVTSQYLAVEYEAVLSSTGSSEKAPSMSKGTADGDYSLQLVDLRTTSKGINSGKHGCLWTLEPVKSKQGAGNFAGDHASFRLGMVAPTGTRDQMLEYLARTHDPGNIAPLPTSKESDEEGVSSDAGSRQSSEGGQAFGQNQNLASESPRRESLMQTGMQQSVRGIQEAIPEKKLYLTSDPATSTLRVQEKDKPFSLSQDCFTVDRVSDPYQRNVRMVTKLVTGLAYFVERVMVSFFKDDLDAAWNLRGGEEKYQDRFFDLGAETQKRNARDRHYFTDEYKKLEEFQIRLLETKMLHRHQDMFTPDADTDTIDALPEEPSPHGSGSRKPSFSFSRHSGGVHSQRKEASESADDIYHVEPKEQCIPETQDKAHQVRREREQKIVHLAEDVVARLANMILFCNADDDYGGYESHEWEKAWRHALDEVFPASAIKERQELLKQSGVIDHLYRVLASTNAKLEELKSRQAAADKKQQSMFNTHGKDVKEGAEAKADREMRANLTLRLETICRVVFKFARHFACRSRENELLLAEGGWIDDLIVMQLGSILGEEECFTDIVSNNEILLDKHISPKTISQCVEIIKEKGLAAGNFLKFLRAVASCEGKPIISNQRDILKMVYSIPTERDKVPLRMDIEKPGGGGGGGHPRPDQDKDKKQEKEKEKQRVLLKTRCRQWKIPGTEEGAKRKQWMSLTKQREAYMRSKQEDRTFEFEGKTDKEGNGLMDPEDGTFRDWLVEVLFTYDYTAELTLIKGAFKGERLLEKDEGYVPGNKNERRDDMENAWRPGGLSTEEVGDRKTVVLTLAHSYEYDWFVAFEELARRYCLMMTILVDVGGSKGDGGGVVSAATAEITEFKLNNEERNVRCTLLCSSAVQDVMSHLMLNKDAKGGRELKYEISANIEVRGVKDKNNLTDMVDGYDSNLQILYQTRDLEKRQAKLKHWGPFFSPRELENVKFWVPLAVLARFLANPITSNKRTHQFLSDAKDGHCRWDGWLQNGALEPEDAELIDPETESPNTIHDTRETNGKNFRRSRIAEYYLQQILLLAELCVGRNNLCITDAFEDRPVGQTNPECTVNDLDRQYRLGLPYVFRAAFTNLLKVLYIDVSPQMPVVVPSLTRPFPADKEKDIKVALSQFFDGVHPHRYSAPGLQTSSLDLQCPPRIDKLFLVEQVLEDYFEKQDGKQDPFDPPGTRLSMQFLTVLQSMVKFGLYQRKSKIVRLIDPLVDLLDGYRLTQNPKPET
ncbi:hypothetical protein T484DRAFT_1761044 [Baffinella frigidus]|nr:hypothetical protein T484DRAFT_1761044 [Cryptophyta sp. CCMP2293]